MKQKFNPSYVLQVEKTSKPGEYIFVELPFTIKARVMRSNYASSVDTEISIYNLNDISRSEMHRGEWELGLVKNMSLLAGYNKELAMIFVGQVFKCGTGREGVDVITRIEAHDNGQSVASLGYTGDFNAGASVDSVVRSMLEYLEGYGVKRGAIGKVEGTLTRGESYHGTTNIIDKLSELTNGRFYIDNGLSYVIADNEVSAGPDLIIDADSGLLDPPVFEGINVKVRMLFEPTARIGQKAVVRTSISTRFKGDFKVIGIDHDINISNSVAGVCTTTLTLYRLPEYTEVPRG